MYITPVIYLASSIPVRFQTLIKLNPISPILESFCFAFLGAGSDNPLDIIYSFGFMVGIVFIGAVMFKRVEATFMDTV
jgi:lipopolysaccharide transport system permease protein